MEFGDVKIQEEGRIPVFKNGKNGVAKMGSGSFSPKKPGHHRFIFVEPVNEAELAWV